MSGTIPETDRPYDVIVIGGGITGAGAARDAALRGLSCLLLEKGDFASGTTSKSTRLIHGGLRYLASFEFGLVAEALRERAILRSMAPYLIQPLPILIPIYREDAHGRALISVGVHLYDLLSHDRDIPHYYTSGRAGTLADEPRLNPEGLTGSALFYDHQIMMPERLVIENVLSAGEAGATLLNHTRAEKIEETGDGVSVTARDLLTNEVRRHRAKVLVNAAGPWIDRVRQAGGIDHGRIIFPTKGVHLVLPKLSDRALFISSRDDRMFFIVPFGDRSLIGTTDTRYSGDLDDVHANAGDVDYLLNESRRIFPGMNITRQAVFYTYAGIRPLAFSGASESKISRKHRVVREGRNGRIVTIAGGKLTTYRAMAKDAVDCACSVLKVKSACTTDRKPFPGGLSVPYREYRETAVSDMAARYKVAPETVAHLVRFYGSRAERVLDLVREDPRLGQQISADSRDIPAQAVYGIREEKAKTLSDIVLRRMSLGTTANRGLDHIEAIASIAAGELRWNADETRAQVEHFRSELDRNSACLRETGR